ncbi:1,4-alpha-glucan branching protein GlgB [Nitrospira defluvii]|nr:1,4-alpha-glucan branching protein GlgB [Nitrospira defluvii]
MGDSLKKNDVPETWELSEGDIAAFHQGNHARLYEKMGSRQIRRDGCLGTLFRVWVPGAHAVSVIGGFNGWMADVHALRLRQDYSAIWEGFFPEVSAESLYKYHIRSKHQETALEKSDPFAFSWEEPPKTAAIATHLDYDWNDEAWMAKRARHNALDAPMSIYELHLGSWQRKPEEGNRFLTYRELAEILVPYLLEMDFTHVEFLPLMEHPFYGSWGYQVTGYFAPSRRFGSPQDLMFLIDALHQHDIGVILDWVPAHFPNDKHGLAMFDGSPLFEYADPQKGFHPDWNTCIFDFGRHEVQSFLMSSACFWLDKYHLDGLRIDAVASMLYLDYSRKAGEWTPNQYGGRENLEALALIKKLNETIYLNFPDVQVIAEESTAWPMVSRPTYLGGLGFGMKWKMGWMHDTLSYLGKDPIYRKFEHHQLTFSMAYAFSENFVLPLSHDEVVHGKGALIDRMPGNDWQQFAQLRLLYGYMYGHPGKKLLFMGCEFAQRREWDHESSLDWHLLEYASHKGVQRWVKDLNHLYRSEKALHQQDFSEAGFEWIDCSDRNQSVLAFLRKSHVSSDVLLFICHFTPELRHDYRIGIPFSGSWDEVLNSDSAYYDGSGAGNLGCVSAESLPTHGRPYSIVLTLPPLSVMVLRRGALDE